MARRPDPHPHPSPATGEGARFHVDNVPAARKLRKQLTSTEAILWERLRSRRCLNLKFRRQHPIGRYVLDFYCEELMVALEIDGGYHQEAEQRQRDLERQVELEQRGIRFVRVAVPLVTEDPKALMPYLVQIFSLQRRTPLP